MADTTTSGERPTLTPELSDELRRYLGAIGTGWRVMSRDKRSWLAKTGNAAKWKLRRLRYGPTGHKAKRLDYGKWRRDHGFAPINDYETRD